MKKLLTIACVLFALAGAGQRWGGIVEADTIPAGKADTILTIMLVCDTTHGEVSADGFGVVSWIRGYQVNVRKQWIDEPGTMCVNCPNYWQFVSYLDRRKNPIRKSIIVWQVKNIQ